MKDEVGIAVASSLADRRPDRGSSVLRIGAILVITIVALAAAFDRWIVSGLVFPVLVQGGSMAPGLLGDHRHWICEHCQASFDCGLESLPAGGAQAACPFCGALHDVEQGELMSGDRVLVDHVAYWQHRPQRWELVVCGNPEDPGQRCVKRVVGLPGEQLRIEEGDIFIDGKILRRSLAEQLATRVPQEKRLQATTTLGVDWLGAQGPAFDVSPYNQAESRKVNEVTDQGIGGLVRVTGPGTIYLRAAYRSEEFLARLELESGIWTLAHNGQEVARQSGTWHGERPVRLEWMLADQRALLAIDANVIFAYDFEPSADISTAPAASPAIGSLGCQLELSDPQVWRDVYYLSGDDGRCEFRLGSGEYFLLGDNSPHSLDSRSWTSLGPLTTTQILGRAIRW